MQSQRLDVRLDPERCQRLRELAEEYHAPVSAVVRKLIDDAYIQIDRDRRRRAVEAIAAMQIEDVPDPDELSRQLEAAHEPGGID